MLLADVTCGSAIRHVGLQSNMSVSNESPMGLQEGSDSNNVFVNSDINVFKKCGAIGQQSCPLSSSPAWGRFKQGKFKFRKP